MFHLIIFLAFSSCNVFSKKIKLSALRLWKQVLLYGVFQMRRFIQMPESQYRLHEIYYISELFSSRSVLSSPPLVSTTNPMQCNIYSSLVKHSYRGQIFCLGWCKGPNHRNYPTNRNTFSLMLSELSNPYGKYIYNKDFWGKVSQKMFMHVFTCQYIKLYCKYIETEILQYLLLFSHLF